MLVGSGKMQQQQQQQQQQHNQKGFPKHGVLPRNTIEIPDTVHDPGKAALPI